MDKSRHSLILCFLHTLLLQTLPLASLPLYWLHSFPSLAAHPCSPSTVTPRPTPPHCRGAAGPWSPHASTSSHPFLRNWLTPSVPCPRLPGQHLKGEHMTHSNVYDLRILNPDFYLSWSQIKDSPSSWFTQFCWWKGFQQLTPIFTPFSFPSISS